MKLLYFRKWNLLALRLKIFSYFLKKPFLMFWVKGTFIFREMKLLDISSKQTKKKSTRKISWYFRKCNFMTPRLKNSLYFRKWNFLALILKKFIYILKGNHSLYFWKLNPLKTYSTSGSNFPSSKNEKKTDPKN